MIMADRDSAIASNLYRIQERVAQAARRGGRDPSEVTIVAVTKTVTTAAIASVVRLGITSLGENRVQEAAAKIAVMHTILPETTNINWHLIGHLQTNKVRQALKLFDTIQSVDSARLAAKLSVEAGLAGQALPILLEVNIGRETAKHGFRPEELFKTVHEIAEMPNILVQGLMTVAPLANNADIVRPVFRELKRCRDNLAALRPEIDWHHLSMGMSNDFEVAIEEGATIVRLGRAIFGERPSAAPRQAP